MPECEVKYDGKYVYNGPQPNPQAGEREAESFMAQDVDLILTLGTQATLQAKQAADQVFRGTAPADLPVEMAEYFLTIYLKTAQAIGLDIPDEILAQADTIIR